MEKVETFIQCAVCYVGFVGTLLFMSGVAGGWVAPSLAEAAMSDSFNEVFAVKTSEEIIDDAAHHPVQQFIYQKVGNMLEHVYN